MTTSRKKTATIVSLALMFLGGAVFYTFPKKEDVPIIQYPEISHLHDEEEVEKTIKKHEIVLLFIHMQKCPPCKKLAPVINQLNSEYKRKNLFVCKADREDIGRFCKKHEAKGFPTVLIFKKGILVKHFMGCSSFGASFFIDAIKDI